MPSTFANGSGAITGLANVAPHTLAALFQLSLASLPSSTFATSDPTALPRILTESQRLQGVVAKADRTIALAGVAGTKWLLQRVDPEAYPAGSELPRRPLRGTAGKAGEALYAHKDVVALFAEENKLKKAAKTANANA